MLFTVLGGRGASQESIIFVVSTAVNTAWRLGSKAPPAEVLGGFGGGKPVRLGRTGMHLR